MKNICTLLILIISINVFSQVPSNEPTDGLLGFWPFNGDANDVSGNGLNGTVSSATLTSDRNGDQNKAYLFNPTIVEIVGNIVVFEMKENELRNHNK